MSAHSDPPASGVEAAPETKLPEREENNVESNKASIMPYPQDVFGDEEHAEVRYKVLTWW
jgi:hypothetical protein